MTDVLSVDFDFWVPEDCRLDMGHREAPFFINELWQVRLADMPESKFKLKDHLNISKTESPKIEEFKSFIAPFCKNSSRVGVGESHSSAFYEFEKLKNLRIINVDAHADLGYSDAPGELDCGNWIGKLVELGNVKSIIQIYPKWRLEKFFDGESIDRFSKITDKWKAKGIDLQVFYGLDNLPKIFPQIKIKRIYIARSGAWVPPWTDDRFLELVFDMSSFGKMFLYTYGDLHDFKRQKKEIESVAR